jgi:ABC-type ATPase involved in cell division
VIQFVNVTKVYPSAHAPSLNGINLRIERGEFVFLVGPSGAGKSSLMKMMYREEVATAGKVIIDGKDLGKLRDPDVPYLRRNLGVIFQDFKLLPERSVFDNVAFALECTDVPRREIIRRVPAALELVGLRHKTQSRAMELSGGEQQRVAVARAIVRPCGRAHRQPRPREFVGDHEAPDRHQPDGCDRRGCHARQEHRELLEAARDCHREGAGGAGRGEGGLWL